VETETLDLLIDKFHGFVERQERVQVEHRLDYVTVEIDSATFNFIDPPVRIAFPHQTAYHPPRL